jgi:hypothetical protein
MKQQERQAAAAAGAAAAATQPHAGFLSAQLQQRLQ